MIQIVQDGVNRVVDVVVVGDRQTAAVCAEVRRLLVLPHAGFNSRKSAGNFPVRRW